MATKLQLPTEIDLVEFISVEAHDLKSPFNRALGFIKLVLKGMDGPISDQAKEDLTVAFQNSLYAMVLMSSLVEVARLSRGERELTLTECQVDSLLQQVTTEWKRQCPKEKSVEVNFSAPASAIKADEGLIRQSFSNWISYVVEFIEEDATVQIRAEDEEGSCLFTIRSTGKKIQSPPKCDLTLYGYIAQNILTLHRGSLLCAEEDEQGALVQFSLPKA
jgi:signal transduction histidine kinase